MGKHRGRFKWKKYSRYKGALRAYWEFKKRMTDRHWEVDVTFVAPGEIDKMLTAEQRRLRSAEKLGLTGDGE